MRVRDYGDGMSLRTMGKATSYLYTSSESYEKQLQEGQRSYQVGGEGNVWGCVCIGRTNG